MGLSSEWITSDDAFIALGEEWDALLPSDARPFDLHCWYRTWWGAFRRPGDELAICVARDGSRLVGVAPLLRRGRDLLSMANVHSAVFRPIVANDEAARAIAGAVAARRPRVLELFGAPADDPSFAAFARGISDAGMHTVAEPQYVSPIVDTVGTFEEWRAETKPRWRANLERYRRKMERDYDADFAIVVEPSDLAAELGEGLRLEAAGWKGEAGTAIRSDESTDRFYREIATTFLARGDLRFTRIVLDGETVAFNYGLLFNGRLYSLKSAYDERFRKQSPGLVMRLAMIERCFETGLQAHELLGEEMEWKAKFATSGRRHVMFRAYPRWGLGLARLAYRRTLRPRIKRVYKSIESRRS